MTANNSKQILRPNPYNIILAFFLSLLSVYGWAYFIFTGNLTLFFTITYILMTFAWIFMSGIISAVVVHYSTRNRMSRAAAFLTISMIAVSSLTMIYACAR